LLIGGLLSLLFFQNTWVVVIARWGGRRGKPFKYRFPDRSSAEAAAAELAGLLTAGQPLPPRG
jgi:hypothetical protein